MVAILWVPTVFMVVVVGGLCAVFASEQPRGDDVQPWKGAWAFVFWFVLVTVAVVGVATLFNID